MSWPLLTHSVVPDIHHDNFKYEPDEDGEWVRNESLNGLHFFPERFWKKYGPVVEQRVAKD